MPDETTPPDPTPQNEPATEATEEDLPTSGELDSPVGAVREAA